MGTIRNRRRTAAHSETHDDKIRFFFGARFFFVFFSFATSCPCFSSFLFFGAAPAERKMKQRRGKRKKRKIAKPTKVKHFGTFFCARKRRKALEVVDAAVWRWGRKKSKLWGWRSDAKGPSIPPSQGRRSGGYPPETPSPPLLGGSSSLWGGAVAQPFPPLTTSCHPLVLLLFLLPPVPITPATSFLLLWHPGLAEDPCHSCELRVVCHLVRGSVEPFPACRNALSDQTACWAKRETDEWRTVRVCVRCSVTSD